MSLNSRLNPSKRQANQVVEQLRERHEAKRGYVSLIADNTGIPRDRIYQWIKGRGLPRLDDAVAVAKAIEEVDNLDAMTYTTTVSSTKVAKTKEPVQHQPSNLEQRVADLEKDLATIKAQLDLLIRLQSSK
jgi:DNA-binding phage protein